MDLETLNKANEMHEKIMTLEFALRDMKEAIKKDRHWTIRVFCKEATAGYKIDDELKEQVMEMLENRLKELKQEMEKL